MENAKINLQRDTKCHVSGRAWNLRYGVISYNPRELLFTLSFSPITVPPVYDHRPGRFVRYIDFNHFRTIGMRRSIEEGVSSRFVTAERLGAILKVSRSTDPMIVTDS